jgi:hypothetical protein
LRPCVHKCAVQDIDEKEEEEGIEGKEIKEWGEWEEKDRRIRKGNEWSRDGLGKQEDVKHDGENRRENKEVRRGGQ